MIFEPITIGRRVALASIFDYEIAAHDVDFLAVLEYGRNSYHID